MILTELINSKIKFLKRGGYLREVASAVVWLLSEDTNYYTGTFIDIAGGK